MRIQYKQLKKIIKEEVKRQLLKEQASWYSFPDRSETEGRIAPTPGVESTYGMDPMFGGLERRATPEPVRSGGERIEYLPAEEGATDFWNRMAAPLSAAARQVFTPGGEIFPLRELTGVLRGMRPAFIMLRERYAGIAQELRQDAPRYENVVRLLTETLHAFRDMPEFAWLAQREGFDDRVIAHLSSVFRYDAILQSVAGSESTLGGLRGYIRSASPGLWDAFDAAYRLAAGFENGLESVVSSARAGYVRAGRSESEYRNIVLIEQKPSLLRILDTLIQQLDILIRVTDTTIATLERSASGAGGSRMAAVARPTRTGRG